MKRRNWLRAILFRSAWVGDVREPLRFCKSGPFSGSWYIGNGVVMLNEGAKPVNLTWALPRSFYILFFGMRMIFGPKFNLRFFGFGDKAHERAVDEYWAKKLAKGTA